MDSRDLRPISAFAGEHQCRLSVVVCNEVNERVVEGIRIVPWRQFLAALWAGEIMR